MFLFPKSPAEWSINFSPNKLFTKNTGQKMFSIKDFFKKYVQIHRKLCVLTVCFQNKESFKNLSFLAALSR